MYKVHTSGGAPGIGTISNGSNSQLFSSCALLLLNQDVLLSHTPRAATLVPESVVTSVGVVVASNLLLALFTYSLIFCLWLSHPALCPCSTP